MHSVSVQGDKTCVHVWQSDYFKMLNHQKLFGHTGTLVKTSLDVCLALSQTRSLTCNTMSQLSKSLRGRTRELMPKVTW